MSVKIRLARGGTKKRPFYRLVATDVRNPRDGRFIEKLGTYNPLLPHDHAERVTLKEERIKYWLGVGAQTSERVAILLGKAGIVEMPKQFDRPKKSQPKAKAQERQREKEEKAAAEAEAEAAAKAEKAAPAAEEAAAEEPAAEETSEEKAEA